MGSTFKDLAGQSFGRLFVVKFSHYKITKGNRKRQIWLAYCECGNTLLVEASSVLCDDTKSCGCLHRDRASKANIEHGFISKNSSKTQKRFYKIWSDMKSRCTNSNNKWYCNYGGRGIKVCDRWLESFENFRDDMWESYNKHIENFGEKNTSIDRWPNVNGNYELSNCKWSIKEEQDKHKRCSIESKNPEEHRKWKIYLDVTMRDFALCLIKNSKYGKYFGCTPLELHNYLQSKFTEGMTWDNYGRYSKRIRRWQIDHIIPANMFDLSLEKDRYLCYNYKNLQPKWADEHMYKSRNKENYIKLA